MVIPNYPDPPTRDGVPYPIVLWIVGEPGVGKTTVARAILSDYGGPTYAVRRPKWTVYKNYATDAESAAAVGTWEGQPFDGGDTVPIGDIKPALEYWAENFSGKDGEPMPLVLFDGDKFANGNAVEFVRTESAGLTLVCLHLVGPDAAAVGRAKRSETTGKTQNDTWVKGRRTKSARFASEFPGLVLTVTREDLAPFLRSGLETKIYP